MFPRKSRPVLTRVHEGKQKEKKESFSPSTLCATCAESSFLNHLVGHSDGILGRTPLHTSFAFCMITYIVFDPELLATLQTSVA